MLGVGLYGSNGHQIHYQLVSHARARVVAYAALNDDARAYLREHAPDAREYPSLEEMLADPAVEMVSLCSPARATQAAETIQALRAGRHVYAEKPCAFSEEELDRILEVSREENRHFRQMSGTIYGQPYWKIREIVRSGVLGEIVQAFSQKSYPNHASRPHDEAIDGGLVRQVGIHAVRFITQCTALEIQDIHCLESQVGLKDRGDLRSTANISMALSNGALALSVLNYANQPGFGTWGYEIVRVWGTKGFVESTDAGSRTRLVVGERDLGPLTGLDEPAPDELDVLLARILDGTPEPLSADEELHPTRMILRAKSRARLV